MLVLEKISKFLNQALLWMAGLFLIAMIAITGANIIIRLFWLPLRGTFELMGYFGAVVTARGGIEHIDHDSRVEAETLPDEQGFGRGNETGG